MKRLAMMACLLAACGDARGTLAVRVGGEEAAERGWPLEIDGETIAFADGWSLEFDRVLASVVAFSIAGSDGERVALEVDPVVADLHGGQIEAWRFEALAARRWERLDWRIAPPTASARTIGGVQSEHVTRMSDAGWSMLLEGRATHPEHGAYELSLGLPLDVDNVRCELEDGTLGIVVPEGGVADTELTFHLDHVFFDDLGAEPEMRFEAWAAAAGEDRVITLDDLASQSLADLRGIDGEPLGVTYDPGATPLASGDLRAFVIAAATSVGHLNGEGHCEYDVAR
ncbi:hypothetical protein [Sandaracinus amylolyticus]|uniref:Putative lipoprotein n=1 Tax=Sandaracinus amylolyticus TaxID=927083 RepID=A0A0F6SF96_9BACT|nr:hypothetical protein [Sandaracinus amylolyticus]AKF06559.1 putative lipoprotein [Sandaracinus amylolyticus]